VHPTSRRDPIREAQRQWVRHGWVEAADGMAAVTSVVRVHQLFMQRIDAALRPFDLSFARYEILMLLSFSASGAMPMTRLGSLLQVHPTSVTSAIARLHQQGFVNRERPETDRRVVLASITEAGHAVARKATRELNTQVFESPGLGKQDVRDLVRLLGGLRGAAGDTVTE
jgi:DNA-binding MarR family transcriptional regulator